MRTRLCMFLFIPVACFLSGWVTARETQTNVPPDPAPEFIELPKLGAWHYQAFGAADFCQRVGAAGMQHASLEGNSVLHTMELPLAPGLYRFAAKVRTDGETNAPTGGAKLYIQFFDESGIGADGSESPGMVTRNTWKKLTVDFKVTKKHPKVRLWLCQSKLKGSSEFAEPRLMRLPPRQPDQIFSSRLDDLMSRLETPPAITVEPLEGNAEDKGVRLTGTGSAVLKLNALLPEKSYCLCAETQMPTGTKFTMEFLDLDKRTIGSVDLMKAAAGETAQFTVPQNVMLAQLVIDVKNGPPVDLKALQINEIIGSGFDWRYWNSFTITVTNVSSIAKRFVLKNEPAYGIARITDSTGSAKVYLNNHLLGTATNLRWQNPALLYFKLAPFLTKGENEFELRFEPAQDTANLAIDILVTDNTGAHTAILGMQEGWELRPKSSLKTAKTLTKSWYKPEQYEKEWVSPPEIPENLLGPFPAAVSAEALPTEVNLNEPLAFTLKIVPQELIYADHNRLKIEWLDSAGKVVWEECCYPTPPMQYAVKGKELVIPVKATTRYLPGGGQYQVRIGHPLLQFETALGANIIGAVTVKGGAQNRALANVKVLKNGQYPYLQINGIEQPICGYRYISFFSENYRNYFRDYVHDFASINQHLYFPTVVLGEGRDKSAGLRARNIWIGPDKYDFEPLSLRLHEILAADPDAYIVLEITVDEPGWWDQQHPDQLIRLEDGRQWIAVSFASQAWREDTAKTIKHIIEYLNGEPFGSRIIGLFFAGFYDSQWGQYMDFEVDKDLKIHKVADYSDVMKTAFRQWLKAKYKGDIGLLNAAWGKRLLDFESAEIPTMARRAGKAYYLDPIADRDIIDYNYCWREQIYRSFMACCEAAKEATQGKWITGGYYVPEADCTYLAGQGQFACDPDALENSGYNFGASPSSYNDRPIDRGGNSFSIKDFYNKNDKFYIAEEDVRTFKTTQCYEPLWGAKDAYETIAVLKRNLCQDLTLLLGRYLFDMYGGWYHSPIILQCIQQCNAVAKAAMRFASLPALDPEMCVVSKSGVSFHKRLNTMDDLPQVHSLNIDFERSLQASNLPFSRWDLARSDQRKYKVYIFKDIFYLDDADRAAIEKLKTNNNILVFMHALGYSDGKALAPDNIARTVGIKVQESQAGGEFDDLGIAFNAEGHPLILGLEGTPFCQGLRGKRFFVNDPDAKTLAVYKNGGQAAVAVKNNGNWTAVYCGVANIPAMMLRNIAKAASVHSFGNVEGCFPSAGHRFFSVYCGQRKARGTFHLKEPTGIYNVFKGTVVTKRGVDIPVDLELGETDLFFLGSKSEIALFRESITESGVP